MVFSINDTQRNLVSSVIVVSVVMLMIYCYAECCHTECHYAESCYAECRGAAPWNLLKFALCNFNKTYIILYEVEIYCILTKDKTKFSTYFNRNLFKKHKRTYFSVVCYTQAEGARMN